MPTYEFQCTCGHIFEDMVTMSKRDLLIMCPKCNKEQAHRTTRIYAPFAKIDGSELSKIVTNPNDGADGN